MNWAELDKAREFWVNEESDTLLELLIDYARDTLRYPDDKAREINMWAIRFILHDRLEAK